jgi:hypothetical protein
MIMRTPQVMLIRADDPVKRFIETSVIGADRENSPWIFRSSDGRDCSADLDIQSIDDYR